MSFVVPPDVVLWVINVIVVPALIWLARLLWNTTTQLRELKQAFQSFGETVAAVKQLRTDVDEIKAVQAHVPTRDEVHGLALQLETLTGEMKAIGATIDGMGQLTRRLETVVTRQEQFLLNQGRPKS